MARKFNQDIAREALGDPKRRENIARYKRAAEDAMTLAEVRKTRKQSQVELAGLIGTSQENISRIERSDNVYLSTIAAYIGALGGQLELTAVFDDDVIPLATLTERLREAEPA